MVMVMMGGWRNERKRKGKGMMMMGGNVKFRSGGKPNST